MNAPTASPENEALTPSSLGAESPPPPPRPPPPQHHRLRPPITLKMPINNQSIYSGPQTAFIYGTAPIVIPMTPTGGHPHISQDVAISLLQAYPNKASEFMFKQFEGFRDFTMNTAKSGLSVGEKLAFWMYGKMRAWSRKWFTHFFLLLVVCAYSLLGALMFVTVEGAAEQKHIKDMRFGRRELLNKIHKIWLDVGPIESIHDEKEWIGRATAEMVAYEVDVVDHFKQLQVDRGGKPLWNFWSAVFYCGTIYTTIGE